MWDGWGQEEVLTQWVLGSQPLLTLVEAPSVLRCCSYCQTQGPFTADKMHFQLNPTPPSSAKVSSKEELAKGQQPSVSPGQD